MLLIRMAIMRIMMGISTQQGLVSNVFASSFWPYSDTQSLHTIKQSLLAIYSDQLKPLVTLAVIHTDTE